MVWKNVSISTVRRKFSEVGVYGRIAVKKSLLRKQNNVKRLQWAKTHKDWTRKHWNNIVWVDESKFKNFRRNMTWRVGERAATPCITPTVKHGGGSVMVWGLLPIKVRDLHQVKGKLNQTGYHSKLQHHAIPSGMRLVGQGFLLMQDNDPKHTNKLS